jgi:hypothetical protein
MIRPPSVGKVRRPAKAILTEESAIGKKKMEKMEISFGNRPGDRSRTTGTGFAREINRIASPDQGVFCGSGRKSMRSLLWSAVVALATLGMWGLAPSQTQAQRWWRGGWGGWGYAPAYSYYYPGYTYAYPAYTYSYPAYTTYYYPSYTAYRSYYYTPGITYTPAYSTYYTPYYRSYYYYPY